MMICSGELDLYGGQRLAWRKWILNISRITFQYYLKNQGPIVTKIANHKSFNIISKLKRRKALMNGENSLLHAPHHYLWDEAAAILSGLIGGGRYGLKIRVPHAVGKTIHLSIEHNLLISVITDYTSISLQL